jgi:hypothetical protein
MALASQAGSVTGLTQGLHKGFFAVRQLSAIELQTVGAGQTPGHERGAVGLANGRGHMKVSETATPRRQRINVGRAQQWMPRTAQVVSSVLVGDEQQEVGLRRPAHQSALMFSSLASWP